MDCVIGLPRTGRQNDAISVPVDRLTKYVHLVPTTPTVSTEGAACLCIDHVFCHHGLSKTIVSDWDPRSTAAFWELFTLLTTKMQMSSANHSETDGQTKGMNRVVEETLRAFVNHQQTNWDELLPVCQFAINNSRQASTGESPFPQRWI